MPLRLTCALLLTGTLCAASPEIKTSGCPWAWLVRVPSQPLTDTDFVELQRSVCYGPCPAYTVRISADGRVTWNGESSVLIKGDASKTIPAAQAKNLIERFRTPEFWSLCDHYWQMVTDSATYKTTASIGGNSKQVSDYDDSAPEFLRTLDGQIDLAADTHLWRRGEPKAERFQRRMSLMAMECIVPKLGLTPLMCPMDQELATIEKLLKANPSVNAADASGWTALMYAAYDNTDQVFDRLLAAGANPKAVSATRQTVLMAVSAGAMPTQHKIERLVALGLDINAVDNDGQTALMFAVQRFWLPDQTAWLLANGARTGIKDAQGKTAADYLEAAAAAHPRASQETSDYQRVKQLLAKAKR
jgi:hypothetical protein